MHSLEKEKASRQNTSLMIPSHRISLCKMEESMMKHVKAISVKKAFDWSSDSLTSIITALTELLALVSTLSTLFGKESEKA